MIFGEGKPEHEMRMTSSLSELAVYPLAVPSIASPGAMMAIVLLTDNHRFSFFDQVITTVIMLSILFITYLLFLMANRIQRLIGNTGAAVISRVMGLILAAVAINNMLVGIRDFLRKWCNHNNDEHTVNSYRFPPAFQQQKAIIHRLFVYVLRYCNEGRRKFSHIMTATTAIPIKSVISSGIINIKEPIANITRCQIGIACLKYPSVAADKPNTPIVEEINTLIMSTI